MKEQPVTINLYYVTDPICSYCWAFEPVLHRFLEQFGDYFNFHTVMGGLLEKWNDGPIDPEHGIYKPADVASHWKEVSEISRMPIDGSLMIDNPITSSYPPSRVFKIIQKYYGDAKAFAYLRRAREELFVCNKNISNVAVNIEIIHKLNLDGTAIAHEAETPFGQKLLEEDFSLARSLGAAVFPTVVFVNEMKEGVKIVGNHPLEDYINALRKVLKIEDIKPKKVPALSYFMNHDKLLFSKEMEVMYDMEQSEVKSFIQKGLRKGHYELHHFLGELCLTSVWRMKEIHKQKSD